MYHSLFSKLIIEIYSLRFPHFALCINLQTSPPNYEICPLYPVHIFEGCA